MKPRRFVLYWPSLRQWKLSSHQGTLQLSPKSNEILFKNGHTPRALDSRSLLSRYVWS